MSRKRARVRTSLYERPTTSAQHQWTIHSDQRVLGVTADGTTLIAAGERHLQLCPMAATTEEETTAVGRLVPFQSDHMRITSHDEVNRYFVVYSQSARQPIPSIRVFDAQEATFAEVKLPSEPLLTAISDAFVDGSGTRILLVDEAEHRMWTWKRAWRTHACDWLSDRPHRACESAWSGRFVESLVFGRCFFIAQLRVEQTKDPLQLVWQLRTMRFSIEDDWEELASTTTSGIISHSLGNWTGIRLSLSDCGRWVMFYGYGEVLHCIRVRMSTTESGWRDVEKTLGDTIVDVAWCHHVAAVLLANGTVRLLDVSATEADGSILTIPIEPSNSTDTIHLQLPAPPDAKATVWHKILWSPSRQSLLACAGATVVEVSVDIIQDQAGDAELRHAAPKRVDVMSVPMHRRRKRRLACTRQTSIEKDLARTLQTPRVYDLAAVTRRVLVTSDVCVVDIAFTLLAVMQQQLLTAFGFSDTASDLVQSLVEMLLAALVTVDASYVASIAAKVVAAPAFSTRVERRAYYANEILRITRFIPTVVTNISQRHVLDMWLREFGPVCTKLLHTKASSESQSTHYAAFDLTPTALDRLIDEFTRRFEVVDDLIAIQLSVLIMSRSLEVDVALLDANHLLQVIAHSPAMPIRSSFLACFVHVWDTKHATIAPLKEPWSVGVVVRMAKSSTVLSHLLQWCIHAYDVPGRLDMVVKVAQEVQKHKELKEAQIIMIQLLGSLVAEMCAEVAQPSLLPSVSSADQHSILALKSAFSLYLKPKDGVHHENGRARQLVATCVRVLAIAVSTTSENSMESLFHHALFVELLWERPDPSDTVMAFATFVQRLLRGSTDEGPINGFVAGVKPRRQTHKEDDTSLQCMVRTIALLHWALWVRERAAMCHSLLLNEAVKSEEVTEQVAICALQLYVLAPFRNDSQDLVGLQLTLLEAAIARLGHSNGATATIIALVISWGFTSDRLGARHLKRLKAIRAALQSRRYVWHESEAPIEFDELERLVELRRYEMTRLVRAALGQSEDHSPLRSPDARRGWTRATEVDTLVTCCADADFQRLAWSLLDKRFIVRPQTHDTTPQQLQRALHARSSTIEGQVSRHEVLMLLQNQRLELEQQVRRLTGAVNDALQVNHQSPPQVEAAETQTELVSADKPADTGLAKPSGRRQYRIRDLQVEPLETTSKPAPSAVLRKSASSAKVLKLLQLRKQQSQSTETLKRHQSVMIPPPDARVDVDDTKASQQELGISRRQHSERVLPLRYDAVEASSSSTMRLLSTSTTRTVSMQPRAFLNEARQARNGDRFQQKALHQAEASLTSASTQCTEMRTMSAQTEIASVPTPSTSAEGIAQRIEHAPVASQTTETNEAAVQCGFTEQVKRSTSSPAAASSILQRFPVVVDLSAPSRKPYVHVAKLEQTPPRDRPVERVVTSSNVAEPIDTDVKSTDSLAPLEMVTHDDAEAIDTTAKLDDERRQQLRRTYQSHYAPAKVTTRRATTTNGDAGKSSSLSSLRADMEQMKRKLVALESCAQEIEDDFKHSQQKLDRLGSQQTSDVDVLREVESALSATESAPCSLLTQKATHSMDSARRLLDRIERVVSDR